MRKANNICLLCPRKCGIDRSRQKGSCGQTDRIKAARAALHFWEEPCISGKAGSGAVFFSGCQLHCVFCQNQNIANGNAGRLISQERLAEIFLELQEQGANNINLVTPDIFVPQLVPVLEAAKRQGLGLPVVYNSSAYVCLDTLRALEGLVDIYLPDLKFHSRDQGLRYANAPDYFKEATSALAEMYRQAPRAEFVLVSGRDRQVKGRGDSFSDLEDDAGEEDQILMKKGLIVRHLLLPGALEEAKRIVLYLWETYGNHIYYSLMSQYTPLAVPDRYPELQGKVSKKEYDKLVDYAVNLGIENGFIQQEEAADESFIPEFDGFGL